MTGESGSGSDAHLTERLGLGRIAGSILALLLLTVPLLSNLWQIPHRTFAAVGPEAERLAFVSSEGGTVQIFAINTDGTGLQQLTRPPGQSEIPVWSPDGRRIAFVSTRDQGLPELYVMNADGTGQRRLTDPELYVANPYSRGQQRLVPEGILLRSGTLHPAWSPDGKQIAFVIRVGLYE